MYTISIINLKGGCAKTTTTLAIADILESKYAKRVLVIDNDKQGNASRTMDVYDRGSMKGSHEMLISADAKGNIKESKKENIRAIPCNLYMKQVEIDLVREKDGDIAKYERYRCALKQIENEYDYCIIDNPPDIGIGVVNALAASDGIIIPVGLDNYSLDGLEELTEQIEQIKEINKKARLLGCLITNYERTDTSEAAEKWLREMSGQKVFKQYIRHSKKVTDSTIYHMPVTEYSIRSGAAQDYKKVVMELLEKIEGKW